MLKRNNGTADYEILQNRFTAVICTSMNNARINYLKKEGARTSHSYDMDEEKFALIPDGSDFVTALCEAESLANALRQIDERERLVILARVLEEKSFEEIADKLGLKYKGVAAIYYRGIAKLKNILEGEL